MTALRAFAPSPFSSYHLVWKLLRARWHITWNSIRRASRRRRIGWAILALVILTAMGAGFILLSKVPFGQIGLNALPTAFATGAFLLAFTTGCGTVLQELYLRSDLELLLSAPLPMWTVFAAKLIQATLPGFLLMLLLSAPFMAGWGASLGYTWAYYISLPLVLALTSLAAAGLSALVVMTIVRAVPARRVAEVLGLIVGVGSLLCSQSQWLIRGSGRGAGLQSLNLMRDTLARLDVPWSPLAWAGHSLIAAGEGTWAVWLGDLVLFAGVCLAAFGVSLIGAERLYYTGWARTRAEAPQRPGRTLNSAVQQPARRPALVPPPMWAVVLKDLRVIPRDLRQLSQLITPLILGVLYLFSLLTTGRSLRTVILPQALGRLTDLQFYATVAITLFVGWSVLNRLGFMAISSEGRNYWLLKTAPLSAGRLLAAKFLVAYLPFLILTTLFLTVAGLLQGVKPGLFACGWLALTFSGAGLTGLSLAFGVAGANLAWESPRQMIGGWTGCLGPVIGGVYGLVNLLLFLGIPFMLAVLGAPAGLGWLAGLSLGLVLSLLTAWASLTWARGQVPTLGEET